METQKTIGIGIIGAGLIADFHAQAIQAIPHAQLRGVYNRSQEKAAVFAEKHHCPVFATVEAMADSPDIHLICICTASGAHLEPALVCIAAGKHCLIEKPMEITLERCDQLIEAARKSGVHLGTVFPSRYHEVNQQLKKALEKGRFGSLVIGNAYVKWSRTEAYYQSAPWRGTWQLDGGGALMNQGIHSVDLLRWFMGPVASVHAYVANRRHHEIEVEDTVVASVRFASGALGTIECSTAIHPGAFKRMEVLGTDGSAVVEENNLITWQFRDEEPDDRLIRELHAGKQLSQGGVADPAAISFKGHQAQLEEMIQAIAAHRPPQVGGPEGRKSVAIIRAIYESARSGKEIHLP